MTDTYRAQPMYVVDGDTLDVFIDVGRMNYEYRRLRLFGINTPELHAKDAAVRTAAAAAKEALIEMVKPPANLADRWLVDLKLWPLRLVTKKDPDAFGRYLTDVYFKDVKGTEHHVNGELLQGGFAVPY